MNSPMISVIMPVYNAEKYVAEAIESILNQTYSDFEFIIIDDGSTDNSYQMLQSYAVKDDRIKLYRNDINLKLPKTLNFGIEQAQGKYIARMDADDISLPERFAKQIEFMESHPDVGVCGTYYESFSGSQNNKIHIQKNPLTHESIKIYLNFLGCSLAHPTIFGITKIFKQHRYSEVMADNAEDYELWLRLMQNHIIFANVPEVLLLYREQQANQLSIKNHYSLNNFRIKSISKALMDLTNDNKIVECYINIFIKQHSIFFKIYHLINRANILNKIIKANSKIKIYDKFIFKDIMKRELSLSAKIKQKFIL